METAMAGAFIRQYAPCPQKRSPVINRRRYCHYGIGHAKPHRRRPITIGALITEADYRILRHECLRVFLAFRAKLPDRVI